MSVYTDLTETFDYNAKHVWTDFDALAENDAALYDGVNPPSFSAYGNTVQTTVRNGTLKLLFDNEEWDTDGWYDTATSRFTPLKAGRYLLTAACQVVTAPDNTVWRLFVYKNGAFHKRGPLLSSGIAQGLGLRTSVIVEADGVSDYFEVDLQNGGGAWGGTVDISNQTTRYFQGLYLANIR